MKHVEVKHEPVLQPLHVPSLPTPTVKEFTKEVSSPKLLVPEPQTISLELHYTMIKWLSLLFISNLFLLSIVFIVLWINR
jgi:hypothetical protein